MKAVPFFVRFQLARLMRFVFEIGPFRALFLLALIGVGAKACYDFFQGGNHFMGLLAIPLMFSIQVSRKDQAFLKVIGLPDRLFYAVIYLLVGLPFAILLATKQEWLHTALVLNSALLIPLLKKSTFNVDALFVNVGGFLPYQYFEWRTGLRQYGLAVIFLMLVGFGLGFYPGTVPIVVFFLTLNTSVFFLQGEAKEMLVVFAESPAGLLRRKIKDHLKLFACLALPLTALFLVFNIELWFIMVYVLVVSALVNINAIIFKYAVYEPGAKLDNNQTLQFLSMGSFLIPFLFPIPVVLSFINYRKALKNLELYM